jgi:hypothetical protein
MSETPAQAAIDDDGQSHNASAPGPVSPWLAIVVRPSEMSITVSKAQDNNESGRARSGSGPRTHSALHMRLSRLGAFIVGAATVVATIITVVSFIR